MFPSFGTRATNQVSGARVTASRTWKRLVVKSYSRESAEPDEYGGHLLTGGKRQELAKEELEALIADDSQVVGCLEASGCTLAEHYHNRRFRTTSYSLLHAGTRIGKTESSVEYIFVTLYRDNAAFSDVVQGLRRVSSAA